jgi:Uma2 family endonuclease
MAEPAFQRATYQNILDAPEHKVAEIINGVLHLSPRPAQPHTSATSLLFGELHAPFRRGRGGPGGWILYFEPELRIGKDVLVPDVAGWREERLPRSEVAQFVIPPDWICETLSKSTEKVDRSEKLAIYAAHGVKHVWLLSAARRTLEVMRLHEGKWLLLGTHRDDAKVRAEPFEAIELDLAVLWSDLATKVPGRAGEAAASYGSLEDDF